MTSWFYSLQFRLIVGFALVLAVALGSVSVYAGYAARQEVDSLRIDTDRARAFRLEETVSDFYSTNKGWAGLQSVIERAGFLSGREVLVLDEVGDVVADSRGNRGHRNRADLPKHRFSPIMFGDRRVGEVAIGSEDASQRRGGFELLGRPGPEDAVDRFLEPPLSRFAQAIHQSLLWAGLIAGAGGILLVSLVSRRTLTSVRELKSAALQLGLGDLSQRVPARGRDEIGQLGRTFNSMADGLESAERQRRHMVADVAHELRTPLSNIQGYVEAVRDGLLEPDSATLGTIHQQVVYLSGLVEDLRLLAETEAADFRLNRKPASLEEAIRRSVEAFRPRADAEGVDLVAGIEGELPLVNIDRTRIEQVVGNLLENAIRHTPSGGRVTISAKVEDAATVAVTVADTLPFVFERFYRVDPSRARATGGAGLGLTIAKQLVEAHGGALRASSAEGEGSEFRLELPLERGPD